MKTYTPDELKTILDNHVKWLNSDPSGIRANLRFADLSSADLSSADLSFSNLQEIQGTPFAQVSWTKHGERGRMLSAVKLPGGLRFFCGCFKGTELELREYITNGAAEHRESRTKALDFILSCF